MELRCYLRLLFICRQKKLSPEIVKWDHHLGVVEQYHTGIRATNRHGLGFISLYAHQVIIYKQVYINITDYNNTQDSTGNNDNEQWEILSEFDDKEEEVLEGFYSHLQEDVTG